MNWHTQMWKKHKVRPSSKDEDPKKCETQYCQYDELHKDYIYTDEWVDLLVKEIKNN